MHNGQSIHTRLIAVECIWVFIVSCINLSSLTTHVKTTHLSLEVLHGVPVASLVSTTKLLLLGNTAGSTRVGSWAGGRATDTVRAGVRRLVVGRATDAMRAGVGAADAVRASVVALVVAVVLLDLVTCRTRTTSEPSVTAVVMVLLLGTV